MSRITTMRIALRAAAEGRLESGWLYLPSESNPSLDSPCFIRRDEEGDEANPNFSQEGLDTQTMEDTARRAREFEAKPTDNLLLESFTYYWRFDAWLPYPGAPDPPPWRETKARLDREFFDSLGLERDAVRCAEAGCTRGAIELGVLCRIHHFEMVKKERCPFGRDT